jgi:hypothetical protein
MTQTNLPSWPGASEVYSRAYRVLEWMGRNGHSPCSFGKKDKYGNRPVMPRPSEDMSQLIDALNDGDEERIKGRLLLYRNYYPKAFDD